MGERIEVALLRGGATLALRALAIGAVIGALAIVIGTCTGCGGGALRANAQATLLTTATLTVAQASVKSAKDAALDRVEAAHPTDPEHDAALDAEVARWRPVFLALDAARSALITWTESIEIARIAEMPDADLISALLPLAAQVVALYDRAAQLAQELGAEVPRLPAVVRSLVRAVGGS